MRYAVISSLLHSQTRIKGKIKASLRVSMEAVRMALTETQREASAYALFLCKVSSVLKLLTFPSTIALQLLQIVMVTKQLLRPMSVLLSY